MKKHDENKDIRLISKIAKIDCVNKTIQTSKSTIIGNRSWGRIDFLTHYCGYTFIWNNSVSINKNIYNTDDSNIKHKRDIKKLAKESTLTNKKKKNNGKNI